MQQDMWGVKDAGINDWDGLRKKIAKYVYRLETEMGSGL